MSRRGIAATLVFHELLGKAWIRVSREGTRVRVALATRAPILVAPAMNGKMWEHLATRENVETLKARGVEFIGPEEGMLACGYEGVGRLWKVDDIAFRAELLLASQDNLIA